eukprot:CAMPEP_0194752310 /NCGR_PEP_ID=MMETSP0323_2-20130528/6089_1 /TAXON_ID=2866 ORGANISM="Crypthecodinium cohnii, Strain Seligo" /NCGR_SAMPLE_ID=MMETSP0323_2 /ASSEMBLY_ACC=CAM_ASM_000346 /LENGTH=55 /DNA_ID=CAMNT_0039669117 /DNA_START=185 /DNA_END=349 /DNA_ORIENTATION=+
MTKKEMRAKSLAIYETPQTSPCQQVHGRPAVPTNRESKETSPSRTRRGNAKGIRV